MTPGGVQARTLAQRGKKIGARNQAAIRIGIPARTAILRDLVIRLAWDAILSMNTRWSLQEEGVHE